jgi:hypothetical protein
MEEWAMSRAIAAYLGAAVVIAWAVLTAIAYLRRERPVPAQPPEQPWDIPPWDYPTTVTTAGGSVTVVDWRSVRLH